ncbi:sodium/hydrogen exchanger 9B1-like [Odontomachus brunneus]|uniref:sodium/hydrogen exchanger 9B1-like n=1 Tax=Odontomachus brunneus TaxID=486640 RepID=UPI0013F2A45A|nr:sodium/hydrogen exchanger 9B1-like [Odontomachus brunneus]
MQPISKDVPVASTSADTRLSDHTRERLGPVADEEDEEWDDNTCCHRATFCNPMLREIIVTDVISTCFDLQLTWADLFWLATVSGLTLLAWAVLYFLLGDVVLPGGSIFGLFVLVVFSYALGWSLTCIPYLHLPPIFGMLLAGIILRNTDVYNIHDELGPGTTSKIRTFCLTFIMVRAGLQLTTTALRAHPVFVMILALVPCSVEMLTVSVLCRYLLEYPWNWSFMTGTIVACMSPVVTVNCMLALAERGYGENKGLASLLCTAASIDDVHIVSLFSIWFSFVFSNGTQNGHDRRTEWWSYIPGGIRDFLLGVIVGIILGFALVFFPHRNHVRSTTAFLTTLKMPFTWKECLFVAISWVPKGTLQAALAPMAFERAREEGDPTKIELALDVVRISVIAIVFLAPLGAIGMMSAGPFLLNKISIEEQQRERELSYLHIVSLQPVRTRRKREKPVDNIVNVLSSKETAL